LLAWVVAVPAITNVDDGTVVSVSTLDNWRSVPLRALLNKVVSCLVIVENDTNLSALGERYRGAARFEETFALINIGTNVSAGIVLGGRIHHGAQWSAGEIGYLRLPKISRTVPRLHEFGELESVLTSSAILKSWHESTRKSQARGIAARREKSIAEILDLAQSGDKRAIKIIESRAAIVSDIIVNLALILNPGLILLAGEVGSHSALLSSVQREVERSEFAVTRIAAASLGEFAALWGAIAAALEEIPLVLLPLPRS
jgi:glucokinase